jgi:hypothetical protein
VRRLGLAVGLTVALLTAASAAGTQPSQSRLLAPEAFQTVAVPDAPARSTRPEAPRSEDFSSVQPPQPAPGAQRAPRVVTATYCAPTPKYCHGWDTAWVGAVDSFRWGDDPYRVKVCEADSRVSTGQCVVVTVVSFCACNDRHGIDLSLPAFGRLTGGIFAPLGRIKVTITRVKGATPTLPPTDR